MDLSSNGTTVEVNQSKYDSLINTESLYIVLTTYLQKCRDNKTEINFDIIDVINECIN